MRAVAQLAAPIRGIADYSRLVSEDYRQYRPTIWTAWAAAAVLAFATGPAAWEWRAALAELRETQIEQSQFLADQARQKREAGDAGSAAVLALDALPDAGVMDRPYVPEAELQLGAAWRDLRERLVLGHKAEVIGAAFSRDGKRIVTASRGQDRPHLGLDDRTASRRATQRPRGCSVQRRVQPRRQAHRHHFQG